MAQQYGGCSVCREPLGTFSVTAADMKFHSDCFRCNQCLLPLPNGAYFAAEGKIYCEKDYYLLYGDRCARCGEIIMERSINAMDLHWHPEHFTCDSCNKQLAGNSFVKRNDRPWCRDCHQRTKVQESTAWKQMCDRCKKPLMAGEDVIQYLDGHFHSYHFNCTLCQQPLNRLYKEHERNLYCPDCYISVTTSSCFTCRKPIQGRAVTALNRQFHPEHFSCYKCNQPFINNVFWEFNGKPYCESHYCEQSESRCNRCYQNARGRVVTALSQRWCENHFLCFACDRNLTQEKFLEWDLKPMCLKCYDEIPADIRRRIYRYIDIENKVKNRAGSHTDIRSGG